jgi:hypothetical protein
VVTGLEPGQRISATLHSDPLVVAGIPAADAQGRIAFLVDVPDGFALGSHTLVIASGDLDPISAAVTVVAPGHLAATGTQIPWALALLAAVLAAAGMMLVPHRRRMR